MTELEVSFIDGEKYYYPDPCPFCGSKRVEFGNNGHEAIQVFCVDCYSHGPEASDYQKATDLWNSRC